MKRFNIRQKTLGKEKTASHIQYLHKYVKICTIHTILDAKLQNSHICDCLAGKWSKQEHTNFDRLHPENLEKSKVNNLTRRGKPRAMSLSLGGPHH
jgi:hypothetical protein